MAGFSDNDAQRPSFRDRKENVLTAFGYALALGATAMLALSSSQPSPETPKAADGKAAFVEVAQTAKALD